MKVGDKITDGTAGFIVRKIGGGGQLIKGIIMAFSGTFDSNGYPVNPDTNAGDTGWHICDGTNGTPDLRGRFILGVSDSHAVGSTGGEESHVLTVKEMPSHRHRIALTHSGFASNEPQSIYFIKGENPNPIKNGMFSDRQPDGIYDDGGKSYYSDSQFLDNTGGGAAHNNMPPYYTLSYIMKI